MWESAQLWFPAMPCKNRVLGSHPALCGADKRHLEFRPSTIAAAAILVAARSSCGEEAVRAMGAQFSSLTTQVGPVAPPAGSAGSAI